MKKQVKKINKKWIILILVVLLLILVSFIIIKTRNKKLNQNTLDNKQIDMENLENAKIKNGEKVNISKLISSEKKYGDLVVKDTHIETNNGYCQFITNVYNGTENYSPKKEISIVFTNKEGHEIARIGYLLPDIDSGESTEINLKTETDLVNAYDFNIE